MSGKVKYAIGLALILGLASAAGPDVAGVPSGQSGCQGCARTAAVEGAASDIPFYIENRETLRSSTLSRLAESLTTPCFHLVSREAVEGVAHEDRPESGRALSGYEGSEYVFLADFSYAGPAAKPGATRLTIELLYNGEPRETVFRLSTDSPIEDYSSQVNRMYRNPDAAINRVKPIDEVLRDFERRPVTCEIDPDGGDETVPGAIVDMIIRDIRDEKGRPSREFNRVVVEARRGRISGGAPVGEGASRQAFRVGDGTVRFQYLAPAECVPAEDEITVHSSCDILDPGKKPLESTGLDRKIASRKIKLVCAEGVLTRTYVLNSVVVDPDCDWTIVNKTATVETAFDRLSYSLPFGGFAEMADYHPILYTKIVKAEAVSISKTGGKRTGRAFRIPDPQKPPASAALDFMLVTDPKTRRVVRVPVPHFWLDFFWDDGIPATIYQTGGLKQERLFKVTGGDGVVTASGGDTCERNDGCVLTTESYQWTVRRVRTPGR